MEALREIYRVLVPGGSLGMIWNIEDCLRLSVICLSTQMLMENTDNAPKSWHPTTKWEAKLKDMTWSWGNETPRFRHEQWREVFDKQLESTPFTIETAEILFSLPISEHFDIFTHWVNENAMWDRYHTLSQFSVMNGEQLEVFVTESMCRLFLVKLFRQEVKAQVYRTLNDKDVEVNETRDIALHGRIIFAWTTAVLRLPLKRDG